jgi:prepilin signal peptidase PulO-like enzyme (type II secretory pathway)
MESTLMMWVIVALCGLLGWAAGMLVNYLADVLPPRDSQDSVRPAWRKWIVILGLMLAAPLAYLYPPQGWNFWLTLTVWVYFCLVAVIDIEHRLVLHATSLVGLILGLLGGTLRAGLPASLVGGFSTLAIQLMLFGLGILFARVYQVLRKQSINEIVFGFGDVILGTICGLMLAFPASLSGLVYTVLLAGAFSIMFLAYLLLSHMYRPGVPFPYAPFILLGTILALYLK